MITSYPAGLYAEAFEGNEQGEQMVRIGEGTESQEQAMFEDVNAAMNVLGEGYRSSFSQCLNKAVVLFYSSI